MKRINYLLLGLAGLAMASCANEDLLGPTGDGAYELTVNLPADMATRSIGDTIKSPQILNYTLFDGSGKFIESGTKAFENNAVSTTLSLPLVKGQSYKLAFFSQSIASLGNAGANYQPGNNAVYSYDPQTSVVTVAYKNMDGSQNNADAYDCFSGNYTLANVGGSVSAQVTLTRPVAQINWGTSDNLSASTLEALFGENCKYLQTQLSMTAYTTLDVLNGTPDGSTTVTIGQFAVPGKAYTYPVSGYEYLAMQYVLAPATENLILTASSSQNADNTVKVEVTNAPLKANFRTNIYGSLLTDQANLTIDLSSDWGGDDYTVNLSTWNGTDITMPVINNDSKTVGIFAASDLAGLAAMVNGTDGQTANNFDGYTIQLNADIDLGGHAFPGIGTATYQISEYNAFGNVSGNVFKGTLEGNDHTISNLSVTAGSNATAAFIPVLEGGSLQNVTFKDVKINGSEGANQTALVGMITDNGSVSNVTVSGTVSGFQYTGAVVGAIISEGSVSGCNNSAVVTGSKYVGGVVGAAMYPTEGKVMSVTNCDNTANITSTVMDGAEDSKYVGGVIGFSSANVEGCSNSGNIQNVYNSTGGVVGEQRNTGYVKNCVNTGATVTQTGTSGNVGGAAGIVGFVRYWNYDYNPYQSPIVVSGNTNYASVYGPLYVGGIVGNWYESGTCENNFNYASTIHATNQFASGIVGTSQFGVGHTPKFTPLGKLIVTGNTTSTPEASITADKGCVDLVIYINQQSDVEASNNTTGVEQQLPPKN